MKAVKPWSCQRGESPEAYEAFKLYMDMGVGRTMAKVASRLGKSEALMHRWSSEWSWRERSRAWDSVPSEAVVEAHAAMARRIAAQHEKVATKLMAHLSRNLDLLSDGQDPTMRFSTALSAARQSHQFATELGKPKDDTKAEITRAIQELILRLAGQEETQ